MSLMHALNASNTCPRSCLGFRATIAINVGMQNRLCARKWDKERKNQNTATDADESIFEKTKLRDAGGNMCR